MVTGQVLCTRNIVISNLTALKEQTAMVTDVSLFLAWLLTAAAITSALSVPEATTNPIQPDGVHGWTPATTPGPIMPADLQKRAGQTTLGYYGGDTSSPYTCGSGSSLVTHNSFFDCCATDSYGSPVDSCTVVTACLDYTARSACSGSCNGYTGIWYVNRDVVSSSFVMYAELQ